MGKKARMKVIRQIAAQLPEMKTKGYEKSIEKGSDLIERGITTIKSGVNGENETKIIPSEKYVNSRAVPVDVNHARRLRKIHTALGLEGIKSYVQHVNKSMETHLAKANANHS